MNEPVSALSPPGEEMISVEHINKRFGGVQALRDVSFSIARGEIHALVGENGAGKSTLMKILAGIYQPDQGSIVLRGEPVRIENPLDARRAGISIVNQELSLFPHQSITANIFVNREVTFAGGLLNKRAMRAGAVEVLRKMQTDLNPDRRVETLTVGEKQLVEIARTLQQESDIIIMDEPNSALNATETERLFELLRRLRDQGLTIIYVSHRLEEVFAIADRISVIRDGLFQGTWSIPQTTIPKVITAMIGRDLQKSFPDRLGVPTDALTVLSVRDLTVGARVKSVSFELRAGEIVGFAGLEGSGITEIFDVLFGLSKPESGSLSYSDHNTFPRSPFDAVRQRLALVPANRREEGLMPAWSIRRNMSLAILDRLLIALGVINRGAERNLAGEYVRQLNVATDSIDKRVINLSGGNQQKVVIAKWLASGPAILILNDPTRGVDVGAKSEVYHLCNELASKGMALLFTSSEVDETIGVCDRVMIMYRGRVINQFQRGEATIADVAFWVSGGPDVAAETVLEPTG